MLSVLVTFIGCPGVYPACQSDGRKVLGGVKEGESRDEELPFRKEAGGRGED